MTNPWIADANNIRDHGMLSRMAVYKTPQIDDFLSRNSSKFFITSTKGYGKTYLLLAKRHTLQEEDLQRRRKIDAKGVKILPEGHLRDRPFGAVSLSKQLLSDLKILETFDVIWSLSIIFSTIRVASISIDSKDKVVDIFISSLSKTPFSYFQRILNLLKDDRQTFFYLQRLLNTDLMDYFRSVHQPIYFFLDDMDEYFEAHIDKRKGLGQTDPAVWYNAQTSLIRVAEQLMKTNHHVKIFIGVRKEAYVTIPKETADSLQIASITVDIDYDQDDLKNIFIKNIQKEKPDYLCDPLIINKNPLKAFLGLDELTNNRILGKLIEFPFDYVLRHTLCRPRDVVFMGDRIRSIQPEKRTQERLKVTINETASEIARQYIREANPFQEVDLWDILNLIPSNVISRSEHQEICSRYHDDIECPEKCQECGVVSPFYTLYKIGLLGIVREHHVDGDPVQLFVKPGEKLLDELGVIPESHIYLIHPILNDLLQDNNSLFTIDRFNIVGSGYRWRLHKDFEKLLEKADISENRFQFEQELLNIRDHKETSGEDIIDSRFKETIDSATDAVRMGWGRRFFNHIIALEKTITKLGQSTKGLQKLAKKIMAIFGDDSG